MSFSYISQLNPVYFNIFWYLTDPLEICLEQKLSTFQNSLGQFDAVLSKPNSDEEEKPFLPFVGVFFFFLVYIIVI